MKISNSTGPRGPARTGAASGVSGVRSSDAIGSTGAVGGTGRVGAPQDAASILGLSEAELTPKVRAALDQLIGEVARLREELDRAKRRVSHLEELADQDTLVPIANRRAFVRELTRLMAFAERYDAPGAVIYFDVNGMKQINDSFGHPAGDAALKHVAEILLRHTRSSDVVGRLGGDEFGVILAQIEEEMAVGKAQELTDAIISEPAVWNGHELEVGVAFGVYAFSGKEHVDEALSAADQRMYAHKRSKLATAGE
ncbi:dgcE [Symbiodinium necroappetens]|uniref:DgcE protein n=1 Tax=Symbiodinium necroappetens TaxID=1628268 RepID=A0A812SZ25_9DINO|nr:dgcE [Symbiodinium necroappetens]